MASETRRVRNLSDAIQEQIERARLAARILGQYQKELDQTVTSSDKLTQSLRGQSSARVSSTTKEYTQSLQQVQRQEKTTTDVIRRESHERINLVRSETNALLRIRQKGSIQRLNQVRAAAREERRIRLQELQDERRERLRLANTQAPLEFQPRQTRGAVEQAAFEKNERDKTRVVEREAERRTALVNAETAKLQAIGRRARNEDVSEARKAILQERDDRRRFLRERLSDTRQNIVRERDLNRKALRKKVADNRSANRQIINDNRRAARQSQSTSSGGSGGLLGFGDQISRARRGIFTFRAGLLVAAAAAYTLNRALLQTSSAVQSMRNQIGLVSTESNRTFTQLFNLAQETRSELEGTVRLFVRTKQALRDLQPFITDDEILRFARAVQQSFIISGSSVQESANAARQLTQALGAGVLRGDEFRSISENNLRLTRALSRQYGVTVGQLRVLAHAGLIPAEAVTKAILNDAEAMHDEFIGMTTTIEQAHQQLANSLTALGAWAAESSGIAAFWIDVLNTIRDIADFFSGAQGRVTEEAQSRIDALEADIQNLSRGLFDPNVSRQQIDNILRSVADLRKEQDRIRKDGFIDVDDAKKRIAEIERELNLGLFRRIRNISGNLPPGLGFLAIPSAILGEGARQERLVNEALDLTNKQALAEKRITDEVERRNEALEINNRLRAAGFDPDRSLALFRDVRVEIEKGVAAEIRRTELIKLYEAALSTNVIYGRELTDEERKQAELQLEKLRNQMRGRQEVDKTIAAYRRLREGIRNANDQLRIFGQETDFGRQRIRLIRDYEKAVRDIEQRAKDAGIALGDITVRLAASKEVELLNARLEELFNTTTRGLQDAINQARLGALSPTAAEGTVRFFEQQRVQIQRQFDLEIEAYRQHADRLIAEGGIYSRQLAAQQLELAKLSAEARDRALEESRRAQEENLRQLENAYRDAFRNIGQAIGQAFQQFENNLQGWINLLLNTLPQIIAQFERLSEAANRVRLGGGSPSGGAGGFFSALFGGGRFRSYHTGGVVPGPIGREQLALVRGGERYYGPGEGAPVTVNFNGVDFGREMGQQILDAVPYLQGALARA